MDYRSEFPIDRTTQARERLVADVLAKLDAIALHYETSHSYDAKFDGGEFSGPANDNALQRALDNTARANGFSDYDALLDEAIALGVISIEPGEEHGLGFQG